MNNTIWVVVGVLAAIVLLFIVIRLVTGAPTGF